MKNPFLRWDTFPLSIFFFKMMTVVVILLWVGSPGTVFAHFAQKRLLRVGAYENPPKIFSGEIGGMEGFWPELIAHIARQENWHIEYIKGTLDECLSRLDRGEIDLMPDVPYTKERADRFVFSSRPVLLGVSRFYVSQDDSSISSVIDLQGETVAVLQNNFNFNGPEGVRDVFRKFNINCDFLVLDSYDSVFKAVESNRADAGVASSNFGVLNAKRYKLKTIAHIFQPIQMRFAFPKNEKQLSGIVSRIDAHMEELINDNDSIYYRLLERHIESGIPQETVTVVPEWLGHALQNGSALFVMALFIIVISRVQVHRKTWQLIKKNRALRDSQEKLKAFFEQAAMGICICESKTGHYLSVNEKLCQITGYSREELSQLTFHQIFHPGDRGNDLAYLDSIQHGHSHTMEKRYLHKDGSLVWVRVTVSPLWQEGRQQVYHLVIAEDITVEKKTRDRLIQSEKMMSIGGLSAGIAHEISTPLADMMMNAQVVINRLSNPTQRNVQSAVQAGTSFESVGKFMVDRDVISTLESIHDTGKNAISTIQNILAFARKSAFPSVRQFNDITRFLDNAVHMIKSKPEYGRIRIDKAYEKDLPLIPCEGNKIQQVFLNILLNGADAMCANQKTVNNMKFFLHVFKNESGVCVRIQDTGPGFDDSIGKSLFEPFFTTKENGQGIGLGLSISYAIIVEDHGGSIRAISTSRGAEFIIHLPVKTEPF